MTGPKGALMSKALILALALSPLALVGGGKSPDSFDHPPMLQTFDAVPLDFNVGLVLPEDSICTIPFHVQASDHVGNVSVWDFTLPIWRVGDGQIVLSQAPLTRARRSSTHAAQLWSAAPFVMPDGNLGIRLVGQDGPVDWYIVSEERSCMVGTYPTPPPSPSPDPSPSPTEPPPPPPSPSPSPE